MDSKANIVEIIENNGPIWVPNIFGHSKRKVNRELVLELLNHNYGNREIANALGIHETTICNIKKELGDKVGIIKYSFVLKESIDINYAEIYFEDFEKDYVDKDELNKISTRNVGLFYRDELIKVKNGISPYKFMHLRKIQKLKKLGFIKHIHKMRKVIVTPKGLDIINNFKDS